MWHVGSVAISSCPRHRKRGVNCVRARPRRDYTASPRDNKSTAIFHAIISNKLTAADREEGAGGKVASGERSRGMPECGVPGAVRGRKERHVRT